jgi:hypothetical protein
LIHLKKSSTCQRLLYRSQVGNAGRRHLISQEHKRFAGFRVPEAHTPEMNRVVPTCVMPVQSDLLISNDTGRTILDGRIHTMCILLSRSPNRLSPS